MLTVLLLETGQIKPINMRFLPVKKSVYFHQLVHINARRVCWILGRSIISDVRFIGTKKVDAWPSLCTICTQTWESGNEDHHSQTPSGVLVPPEIQGSQSPAGSVARRREGVCLARSLGRQGDVWQAHRLREDPKVRRDRGGVRHRRQQ